MSKIKVTKLHTLSGHNDSIYVLEGGEEPEIFFSAAADGMVARWNLKDPEKGRLIAQVKNSIYAMHYHQASNSLIIGQNNAGIHHINLRTNKEIASAAVSQTSIFDIKSYQNQLYIGTQDGMLINVQLDDLSVNKKIKASDKSLRTIAIHAESGHVATGFSDNSIRIFDLKHLDLLLEIPSAHKISIFSLNYSPCGKYLLSTSRDAHIKIWDVNRTYQLKGSIVAHMYAINHLTYSPDGQFFATCSMDKSIKIWDATSFDLLKVIDKARHAGHGTSVNKLYWSAFGNQLVSCSDDRSISVWDIDFAELVNNP